MTPLPAGSPRMLPDEIDSFQSLVHWLAKEHHDGKYYPMARRLAVSPALIHQWKDGLTRSPRVVTFSKLCHTYNLDESDVINHIFKRR